MPAIGGRCRRSTLGRGPLHRAVLVPLRQSLPLGRDREGGLRFEWLTVCK